MGSGDDQNDEAVVFDFSGFYSRFSCPCGEVFEVEDDARGDDVECDACGLRGKGGS